MPFVGQLGEIANMLEMTVALLVMMLLFGPLVDVVLIVLFVTIVPFLFVAGVLQCCLELASVTIAWLARRYRLCRSN